MRHGIRFNSLYKANLNNLLPLLLWLLVLQIPFNCGHGILFIYIANQQAEEENTEWYSPKLESKLARLSSIPETTTTSELVPRQSNTSSQWQGLSDVRILLLLLLLRLRRKDFVVNRHL